MARKKHSPVNHGSGWIIFEESYHKRTRKLMSILPARRNGRFVADFMEQLYTDRHASLSERLRYKKNPKLPMFRAIVDLYNGPIHVGHDPFLVGLYAHKITLDGNVLGFQYKIATNRDDPFNPVFEDRFQSLQVEE